MGGRTFGRRLAHVRTAHRDTTRRSEPSDKA
jgi:hypothetical protein